MEITSGIDIKAKIFDVQYPFELEQQYQTWLQELPVKTILDMQLKAKGNGGLVLMLTYKEV